MKFKDYLSEAAEKHGVLAYGRMNPPTAGHEQVIKRFDIRLRTFPFGGGPSLFTPESSALLISALLLESPKNDS